MHLLDRGELPIESSFWQFANCRYCYRCRAEISRERVRGAINHPVGWCENCRDVVGVSRCRVSYWFVTATLVVAWADTFVNIFM